MKAHIGIFAIVLMLSLQGCATATVRDDDPDTMSESAATDRNLLQKSPKQDFRPQIVLDRDPYEGHSPDICHRSWLAPAIAFESGSSELVPCAIRVLDESVSLLLKHPNLRVKVAGHAASAENDVDKQALSLRRARIVYDYLVAHEVPRSMLLEPVGYGSERLLEVDTEADGSISEDDAKINRRVELNVQN